MGNLSVFGAQWGDEGKGKEVDIYTDAAYVVVRYGGGNNAGHTLVIGDQTFAVHLLPSGIVREGKVCVLGDGMVINPGGLLEEIDQLERAGLTLSAERIKIGLRAHLVLPYHCEIDALREQRPGAIGTTRRGIGPAYEDRVGRRGIRVSDLLHPTRLQQRLASAMKEASARIVNLGGEPPVFDEVFAGLLEQAERLEPYIADTGAYLAAAAAAGKRLLFEGAQGVLLDIDHGTYPFVTSSHTLPAAACAGAGVGPALLGEIVGVTKAYTTRVGEGPFPTEAEEEAGELLREAGGEFGATTGRPRRCGWLDLPALRHAVRVTGMQHLALTKLDVLAGLEKIPVCEAYRLGDRVLDEYPADPDDLSGVVPVYREHEGFGPLDAGASGGFEGLPSAARAYIEMIEGETGLPVSLVSLGPERQATLVRTVLG